MNKRMGCLGAVAALWIAASSVAALADGATGTTLNESRFSDLITGARVVQGPQGDVTIQTQDSTALHDAVTAGTGGKHNVTVLELAMAGCAPCAVNTAHIDEMLARCPGTSNAAELLLYADPSHASSARPWVGRRHPVLVPRDWNGGSDTLTDRLGASALPVTLVLVDGKVVFRSDEHGGTGLFDRPSPTAPGPTAPVDVGAAKLGCIARANGVADFRCGAAPPDEDRFCAQALAGH